MKITTVQLSTIEVGYIEQALLHDDGKLDATGTRINAKLQAAYKAATETTTDLLIQEALNIITRLLNTCEMNMDDMEPETVEAIEAAAAFQHYAAKQGFTATEEL